MTVTVYIKPGPCPACTATKRHLARLGIDYAEILIDSDSNIVEAISYLGLTSAPVVCASTSQGEEFWAGYRPDRIDALGAEVTP